MSRSLKRRRGGVICSPFPSHLRHTYVLPIGLGGLAPKAQISPPAPTREGRLGGPFPSTPHALLSSLRPYIFHAHPGATASPRPGSVAQKHHRGKPAPTYVHCVLRKGSCQVRLSLQARPPHHPTHRQTHAWKARRRACAPGPGALVPSQPALDFLRSGSACTRTVQYSACERLRCETRGPDRAVGSYVGDGKELSLFPGEREGKEREGKGREGKRSERLVLSILDVWAVMAVDRLRNLDTLLLIAGKILRGCYGGLSSTPDSTVPLHALVSRLRIPAQRPSKCIQRTRRTGMCSVLLCK